ncbi:MAG: hypothetical protein IIV87_03875, partial [Oscillospiraceae bacterium]|nr:hypothetical protein [Oscillospiraceae bacterium]
FTGFGFGPHKDTMAGYPHFRKVCFDGSFPIAKLTFEDEHFPAKVIMTAFNPFIPLDADNSSIPAAFFDIRIQSRADGVKYSLVLSVTNPFASTVNRKLTHGRYTAVQMVHDGVDADDIRYGDLTVGVDSENAFYQECWYRGKWQDKVTTFWREFSDGRMENRCYPDAGRNDTCSVGASSVIDSGKAQNFRFALSWNVPNNYNYWNPCKDENGKDKTWKNYYAKLFADSSASCLYCLDNWDMLYRKTKRFADSLHGTTLDKAVIDAASSTLSVLKSSTVLRLQDGTFYGWEGVHFDAGSCEGTCTHVWSYAYALCFLFPELERSLRETEFRYDTDEHGRMYFRTALPLGRERVELPPCLDGQMSTVIKIYRDWKLTGDTAWLKDNWANIQKILEYAWSEQNAWEWDLDKDGVLEGRQHHTLDMELFGPSSWLEGLYLCALKAAAEMAEFLGDDAKHAQYTGLFEAGRAWMNKHLFNGKYFFQKVDLGNHGYIEHFSRTDYGNDVGVEKYGCEDYWNEEAKQLKYQIGDGCEIDQMLGQWHANICGLGEIFEREKCRTALRSMLQNNFKPSMREFANMWRVFAVNDEAGAVMCDYPEGAEKPIIPIPYCEECMTGFEYSFAGLLISEGFIDEGLQVVRAIRDRYDGEKRNPYNEIECGSNYARAMASFALLPIFSGFQFDLPNKHIGFAPLVDGDFKCMWNLGCAWGDFSRTKRECSVSVKDGSMELASIELKGIGKVKSVIIDGKDVAFAQDGDKLAFAQTTIKKHLRTLF